MVSKASSEPKEEGLTMSTATICRTVHKAECIETLPAWVQVWRKGFAPQMSTAGLEMLREALANDDDRLVQGTTLVPPPLDCCAGMEAKCFCALSFTGLSHGLRTVGELESYFSDLCYNAEHALGYPHGPASLLNHYDDHPREQVFAELLEEVELALDERYAEMADAELSLICA